MKKNYLFRAVLFILSFVSCNFDYSDSKNCISKLFYKEIVFPDDMVFVIKGDTVEYDFKSAKYKILTYADSADCIGCRLKLEQWNDYLSSVDNFVSFIMVINNKDVDKIVSQTKFDRFDRPISIDIDGQFIKNNEMPQEIQYQTFLLDSLNRVIVVGNPLFNHKVDSLYHVIINK